MSLEDWNIQRSSPLVFHFVSTRVLLSYYRPLLIPYDFHTARRCRPDWLHPRDRRSALQSPHWLAAPRPDWSASTCGVHLPVVGGDYMCAAPGAPSQTCSRHCVVRMCQWSAIRLSACVPYNCVLCVLWLKTPLPCRVVRSRSPTTATVRWRNALSTFSRRSSTSRKVCFETVDNNLPFLTSKIIFVDASIVFFMFSDLM